MSLDPSQFPRVLTIVLELSNYPILAGRIRERMRQELFRRNVISPEAFEVEVQEKAVQSQRREGLHDPWSEEPPDVWAQRVALVRDDLTDFYFAYNLPHDDFAELVREVLTKRVPPQDVVLTFHPELAPWDMLIAQGEAYEALPPVERGRVEHHLEEIKVVLIKAMISDHLQYIAIAKEWLSIEDLKAIRARRFSRGKIGGKAAGIVLAEAILRTAAPQELLTHLRTPRSWFLGADVFYHFTQLSNLLAFSNQKYLSDDEISANYPLIRDRFGAGEFPSEVIDGLRSILEQVGRSPLIVRSSSLLEDSFGTSFAGKYESHFCPNQGSAQENLDALCQAISQVYATVYSPDVVTYRRRMGLLDYDERMAILIQEVQGRRSGTYFRPDGAGVAFSRNQFRWSPSIDREAGFVRLVWGLGTRAVEQHGGDYPRLVALSHPALRPEADPLRIQRYSQHHADLIDLQANALVAMPISEAIDDHTPHLQLIAQRLANGSLRDIVSRPVGAGAGEIVLTFDGLLRRTRFPPLMRTMLELLKTAYRVPVDIEFAFELSDDARGHPQPIIHLLQCRPQSSLATEDVALPKDIPEQRRIFVSRRLAPDGRVSNVRYIVWIPQEGYAKLGAPAEQKGLARAVGRLNRRLAGERFMLIGPGRWGSVNPDRGVPVTYSDICNARALVEVVSDESAVEPSYGTHFFQDLVEAGIYTLALALDDPGAEFNESFLRQAPNALSDLLPQDAAWEDYLRVVDVLQATGGMSAELVMDGGAATAMAYLAEAKDGG